MKLILISVFGMVGVLCRYFIGSLFFAQFGETFPWGTLTINVVGSFLIGIVFAWGFFQDHESLRAALAVGFLGGFTTFSAFSLETVRLIHSGRINLALLYVLLSVITGIGAAGAGYFALNR